MDIPIPGLLSHKLEREFNILLRRSIDALKVFQNKTSFESQKTHWRGDILRTDNSQVQCNNCNMLKKSTASKKHKNYIICLVALISLFIKSYYIPITYQKTLVTFLTHPGFKLVWKFIESSNVVLSQFAFYWENTF